MRGCCDFILLLFFVVYIFVVVNVYPTDVTNTCQYNLIYFFLFSFSFDTQLLSIKKNNLCLAILTW